MNTIMRKNLNLKGTKDAMIYKGYYHKFLKRRHILKKISLLAKQLIDVKKYNGEGYFAKTNVNTVRD